MTKDNEIFHNILEEISKVSPEVAEIAKNELDRNRNYLNMIASENYPSLAAQYACSLPCFNTKYAEGHVSKKINKETGEEIIVDHRHYAGCENINALEQYTADLACEVFGAEHAFVQFASGSDANMGAYYAILNRKIIEPYLKEKEVKTADQLSEDDYEELRQLFLNQTLLSMDLESGGHLTHGSRANLSSKIFKVKHYPLNDLGYIDYDIVRECALKYRPLILLAGYSAYPRKINYKIMKGIADEVGAVLMVDMSHFSGLLAGKVYTGEYTPIEYADIVTSTSHKSARGPRHAFLLCKKEWSKYVDKACPNVMGGPLMNQIAGLAVSMKEALFPDYQDYAHQIVKNAKQLAETLMYRHAHLITNGTDNHMVLIDVRNYGLTGKEAEQRLYDVGITCNKNTIPFDPNGVLKTSGIRLGAPALTTLGMKEKEMVVIANIIADTLEGINIEENKIKIKELLKEFPLYPSIKGD